jgi:4-amino-4-deoxy-L-arabinose transferase-like glycosyltransferase
MAHPPPLARRSTIAVLLLALALRVFVLRTVVVSYPQGWLFTRGLEMGWLANSLLAGKGLASPFGTPTGPTAFVAPGYPILIAGIFRLFGANSVASAVVVMALQIVFNLITIWLMMRIARTLFNQRTASITGLIWAVSPPLLWMQTIFWDTSLAICLLTGVVAFALHLRARMTNPLWLLLGALCAVTALINPAMLFALGAIVLWLAFQQPTCELRGVLLATLTFAVVFSPWPLRNARVFHAFIPLRTTVGFEMWMGNRPGATGYLDESLFPAFNPQELNDYKTRGELGYTAHKSALARQFILDHPATFARLTLTRILRYWLGTGNDKGSPIFALHAIFTSALGLFGLGLLVRRRRYAPAILFALPLLLFPLPYYISHAEFRYRLGVDTLLSILAAHAIVALASRADRKPQPAPAPVVPMQEVHV